MTSWPETLNADTFFLRDRLAEGHGASTAIIADGSHFSYAEVDQRADGIANELLSRGIQPGDRVFVVMPDGLDFAASLFAVFRVGAVVVMLNPGLTPETTEAIESSAEPAVVIVHDSYANRYRTAVGSRANQFVLSDDLELSAETVTTFATAPSDPAIWLFSGGTTGVPKAVVQSHRSLVNTTRLYGQGTLAMTAEDRTLAVPKLYFGYATGSNLLFPFSVGATSILFTEPSTPEAIFNQIESHQPTVLVNVPSAINQMLADDVSVDRNLGSLRLATSAGEALPETLYHRWVDAFGVELLDGLGTAEMWHIFISNVAGEAKPGTLGRVVPGFEIKACDEEGNEVPEGDVGRLWVRGESLGIEYWKNPDLTAESFLSDNWFVGGDLISIDHDGFVTHRGRGDDAIKVKGKWFRPQEVESVLLDHPAVSDCAVVAVEDENGLTRPVAFVVPSAEVTPEALKQWVLDHLEAYKHPRRVYLLDALPKTHLGKVDRGALKRQAD